MVKTSPARGRLARAAPVALPLLVVVVSVWVATRVLVPPPPGGELFDPLPWHLAMICFGVVGVVIIRRRPDHPVGWLFLVVGIFDPLSAAIRGVAIADLGPREIPAADVAAWVQSWIWAPSLGALSLLLWVFPTGRPPAGVWRWGVRLALAALFVLLVPSPVLLWEHRGPGLLFEEAVPGVAGIVVNSGFMLLMLATAGGAVSVVVRLRRSRGVERQQMKWFAYAAAMTMMQAFLDIVVLDALGFGQSMAREVASSAALVLIPISAAIALLRYRLYDIDRLINRTVVYGALTAGLAAAYLGVVAVARWLTTPMTGDSSVAVAASTLVVAALFRPARRRLQEAVDRRFNRASYDAARTVRGFSGRLRDEVELEALTAELLGAVSTTMQPTRTLLWLNRHEAAAPVR